MWHKGLSPLLSDVGDADEVVTGKITIPQTPTFTRWGGWGGAKGWLWKEELHSQGLRWIVEAA